ERKRVLYDLGSRPLRRPSEAGDFGAIGIGQLEYVQIGGQRVLSNPAQVEQLQTRADVSEDVVVDELDAQYDRRDLVHLWCGLVRGGNCHPCEDGGASDELLQPDSATRLDACRVHCADIIGPPSNEIEHVLEVRTNGVEPIWVDTALA